MRRYIAISILVFLTLSSIFPIETSFASIIKPSIPQFSAKFIDNSYDMPPTHSIDPYTGQSINKSGYHIENYTAVLTISNQQFAGYYDVTSTFNVSLYYNVRVKGHYAENWINLYSPDTDYPKQSTSEYTNLTFVLGNNADYPVLTDISKGAEVDFQVQALVGYVHRTYDPNETVQILMFPWVFTGESSGWSHTQTITIGDNSLTPTPLPASISKNSVLMGLDWMGIFLIILVVAIVVSFFLVIVFLRKRVRDKE